MIMLVASAVTSTVFDLYRVFARSTDFLEFTRHVSLLLSLDGIMVTKYSSILYVGVPTVDTTILIG